MTRRLKCLIDNYFMLRRLQDDLILLKVGHRNAEQRCQFHLEAGNIELAKSTSDTSNMFFKEIIATRKEIEKLESAHSSH